MSRILLVAGVLALCSGCASVTKGTTHLLRIETETAQGQRVDDADCSLSNDQGTTIAKSGTSTSIRRSGKDLEIRCTKAGLPDAEARLVSRANAGLAGNILVGGGIGALIDHNTGAAYTYPSWVRLVFGEFVTLDRRDEREGTVLAASPGAATVVVQTTSAPRQVAPTLTVAASAPQAASAPARVGGTLARGDTFEYRLTDRITGNQRTVVLRVDRTEGQQVRFNDSTRVEGPNAELLSKGPALLGELDEATPPGGWMPNGQVPRGTWPIKFSRTSDRNIHYELTARAVGEQVLRTQAGQFKVVRVELDGWFRRSGGAAWSGTYKGVIWLSPELRRPIRFEARTMSYASIDEEAELIAINRD